MSQASGTCALCQICDTTLRFFGGTAVLHDQIFRSVAVAGVKAEVEVARLLPDAHISRSH